MMNNGSLFIIIIALCYLEPAQVSCERNKRIIYGHIGEEDDRDYYSSFRYYVFLARQEASWARHNTRDRLSPGLKDFICGGTLIAPFVVQTAAHCLASPEAPQRAIDEDGNDLNYMLTYYRANEEFELQLYSFIGNNVGTRMIHWHRPKQYMIRAETRQVVNSSLPIENDVGMIILEDIVPASSPNAEISYAPVYNIQDISDYYGEVVGREYTCLTIGHGLYDILSIDEDGIATFNPDPSDPVRWGWRTLMNYVDCETNTLGEWERMNIVYYYEDLHTWVCAQSTNHLSTEQDVRYSAGRGDSGGPVECGGHYFSVVQGSQLPGPFFPAISVSTPIFFSLNENCAESRDIFLFECDQIRRGVVGRRKLHPPLHKRLSQLFDQLVSQASLKALHKILLMTTTTIFALLLC